MSKEKWTEEEQDAEKGYSLLTEEEHAEWLQQAANWDQEERKAFLFAAAIRSRERDPEGFAKRAAKVDSMPRFALQWSRWQREEQDLEENNSTVGEE